MLFINQYLLFALVWKTVAYPDQNQKKTLHIHNLYRKWHLSKPLQLSREMSEEATKYALELSIKGILQQSNTSDGENLALLCGLDSHKIKKASQIWYNEVCQQEYDFSSESNKSETLHFTQLIWKNTSFLGIGFHTVSNPDNEECTFVVARYRPSGNLKNKFKNNVNKGYFDRKKMCIKLKKDKNTRSLVNTRSQVKPPDDPTDFVNSKLEKQLQQSKISDVAKTIAKALALGAKVGAIAGAKAGAKAGKYRADSMKDNLTTQELSDMTGVHTTGTHYYFDDTQNDYLEKLPSVFVNKISKENFTNLFNSVFDAAADAAEKAGEMAGRKAALNSKHFNKVKLSKQNNLFKEKSASNYKTTAEYNGLDKEVENEKESSVIFSADENKVNAADATSSSIKFEEDGLRAHNYFRKIHNSPDMKLNSKMSEEAEKYAQYLSKIQDLKHSSDRNNEGENLAYGCNSGSEEMSAAEAVRNWYAEVCKPGHDFKQNSFNYNTGHFTQVVWKGSTELGMGKSTSKKDGMFCTYIVGRYKPAGNMGGEFTKNVLVGSFDKKKTCDSLDDVLSSAAQPSESKQGSQSGSSPSSDTSSSNSNSPASIPSPAPGIENNGGNSDENSFDQLGLNAHNILRKIHNAPDMKLNSKMSEEAEKYAKHLADIQELKHSTDRNGEGENLAYGCNSAGTEMSAAEAVKNWYAEVCSPGHDFSKDGGSGTGHFTQVVWKGSTELGMGKATSKKDGMFCTYIVGRYKPAGNMLTQFTKNVFEGSFDKKKTCDSLDNLLSSAAQPSKSKQESQSDSTSSDSSASSSSSSNSPAVIPNTALNNEGKGASGDQNAFDQLGLNAHNILRKIHDAPDMKLNSKMSEEAEKYAKHLADIQELKHSTDRNGEGENLAYGCNSAGTEMSAAEAVKNWYAEVCSPGHDFTKDGGSGTGHFTQVVWKDSTELGMGKATSKKGGMLCTYIVGRYKPAGNMLTQFTKNVFEGSFDKKKTCNSLDNLLSSVVQPSESKQGSQSDSTSSSDSSASNSSNSNSPAVIPNALPSSESKAGSNNQNSFDQSGLKAHNILRKIHNAPDMELNPQLSADAQKYAEHLADIQKLQHASDLNGQGENLAYGCNSAGTEMSAAEAVKNWYSEVCSPGYDFDKDGDSATGHFTQVVWKASTELGMGKATSKKGGMFCTYIVGRYKPAGNMLSQFTNNVLKGSFDKTQTCDSLNNILSSASQQSETEGSPSAPNNLDSSAAAPSTNGDQTSFCQIGLNVHNIFRKIHGVPLMALSKRMSDEAENYAKYLATIQSLKHSSDLLDEGENLAYGCNSVEMTAAEAVKMWYSEVCNPGYNFDQSSESAISSATGHFTQVVWKTSTQLGIGKSVLNKEGMICTYVVGRYKLAGNVLGQYKENVLKGNFDSKETCMNLDGLINNGIPSSPPNANPSSSSSANPSYPPSANPSFPPNANPSFPPNANPSFPPNANPSFPPNANPSFPPNANPSFPPNANPNSPINSNPSFPTYPNPGSSTYPAPISPINNNPSSTTNLNPSSINSNPNSPPNSYPSSPKNSYPSSSPNSNPSSSKNPNPSSPLNPNPTPPPNSNLIFPQNALDDQSNMGASSDISDDTFPNEKQTLAQAMSAAIEAAVGAAYDVGKKIAESIKGGKEFTPNPKEALNSALNSNKRQFMHFLSQKAGKRTLDQHDEEQSSLESNPEKIGAILGAKAGAKAGAMAAANFIEQEVKKKLKSSFSFIVKNPGTSGFMSSKATHNQGQETFWNVDNSLKNSKTIALEKDEQKQETLINQSNLIKNLINQSNLIKGSEKKLVNSLPNTVSMNTSSVSANSASVESAAKIGALIGAKAGAEAAVNSIQQKNILATKKIENVNADAQGQMWKIHLDEDSKVVENQNYYLCAKRNAGNSSAENDMIWKSALEGAQIGAEKGAISAADEVIRSLGFRGFDKLKEKRKARSIGLSVAENEAVVIAKRVVQDFNLKLTELKTCIASQKSDFHESSNFSLFSRSGLEAHNKLRKAHGVPDLVLDLEMTKKAEEYAEKLSKLGKNSIVLASPLERDGCGENLAVFCTLSPSQVVDEASEAVTKWYSEVCTPGYSFNDNTPSSSVLHFTQVVWKSSTLLGMGKFTTKTHSETCTYVVARYKKPGNVAGLYKSNVMKGNFDESLCLLMKNSSFISGPVITQDDTEFISEMLDAHNKYRAIHHAQPLAIDDKLAADAQSYAEIIAKRGTLQHELNINDGENLAMKCLGPQEVEPNGVFFTTLWYQEVCNPIYKFNGVFDQSSSHFTQVVWADTKFLGVGRAQSTKGGVTCQYIVSRYRPAGNFVEEFDKNVLKGSFIENICKGLSDQDKRHHMPKYRPKNLKTFSSIGTSVI
ncbi:uncharacterized protein LOC100206500 isoform X3 [Hydra vulgaris]|uniref:Uncharacterized protein LOC100206500 isoform X3 n=1 Tax=Hydra vulgaris TaxID=6087 RepID=A0ABM4DP11_HYDVU